MSNFEDVKDYNTTTLRPSFLPLFLKHLTLAAAGVLHSRASGPVSFTHLLGISCHIGANGIVSAGV